MKKDKLKGLIAGILIGCLLCGGSVYAISGTKTIDVTYRDIKVYKDGVRMNLTDANGTKVEPFIYNGTTYLPVRGACQLAGMDVEWDGKTSSVYLWDEIISNGTYFVDICAPYKVSGSYVKVYQSSDTGYFSMCGEQYGNGLTLMYPGTSACFNLDAKYSEISMDMCFVDESNSNPMIVSFFVDGEIVAQYEVKSDDYVKSITVPLNYGLQLRIETSYEQQWTDAKIGLGNIVVK